MKEASTAVCLEVAAELIPLALLRAGQTARVGQVFGPVDLVHRLREMGLRDGAEVEMVRPGSPCLIRVGGQKLGFRGDEVTRVLVSTRHGGAW